MIKVGLFVTQNKNKLQFLKQKLLSQIIKNNKIEIVDIYSNDELKNKIDTLEILLTYNIKKDIFKLSNTKLRWIQIGNAGVDNCMFEDILKSEIIITNSRGINSRSVSEYVISTILFYSKSLADCIEFKKNKKWTQWEIAKKNYTLENKIIGLIGFGAIGKDIAKKAKTFNMKVIAIKRLQKIKESKKFVDELLPMDKIDYLIKKSDYLIIACPLTPLTKNMIDKQKLKLLSNESYIINISRGEIINEKDLITALKKQSIKGAILDVFNNEPLNAKSELFDLDNVFISPHISGNFSKYQIEVILNFSENLNRYLNNKPLKNRVCKKRLY